jgi:hypothetical protein
MPFLVQPLGVDFGGVVSPIKYDTVFYLAGFGDGAGHSTARAANTATYCYIHDTTDAGYSNYGTLSWASTGSVAFTAVASDTRPTPAQAVTAVASGGSLAALSGQYLEVRMSRQLLCFHYSHDADGHWQRPMCAPCSTLHTGFLEPAPSSLFDTKLRWVTQVCATLTRASPPAGSGPSVLGASPDITSITVTPAEKPPQAYCDSPITYTLPSTSCLIPNDATNFLLINNASFDPNLVDKDSLTFAQSFPDSFGSTLVSLVGDTTDHYNLGTTTVELGVTDSLGETSNCSTTVTVKVSLGPAPVHASSAF